MYHFGCENAVYDRLAQDCNGDDKPLFTPRVLGDFEQVLNLALERTTFVIGKIERLGRLARDLGQNLCDSLKGALFSSSRRSATGDS